MLAARVQCAFGAWIVALTAAFYAVPEYGTVLWAAIGLSAAGGVLIGVRLHRPRRWLPWYLLAGALASFTLGDTTYNILVDGFGMVNPSPSPTDVFYLAVYPMLAVALLIFIRARSATDNRAALLDALLPTAGLGLLSWVFLVSPYLLDGQLSVAEKLTSIAYPLGDVLTLAMLCRLMTVGGRKPLALKLLAVGVLSLLITDVIYLSRHLDGTWAVGGPVDSGWVLFYLACALAALDPSMRLLSEGEAVPRTMAGNRRLVVLSVATLIAPIVLLVEDLRGHVTDAPIIATASGGMFLLVMARVAGLLQMQRETVARERTLRVAGADLVVARGELEAREAVRAAVGRLMPTGQHYVFHTRVQQIAGSERAGRSTIRRIPVSDLPDEVAVLLAEHESALMAEFVSPPEHPGGPALLKQAFLATDTEMLLVLEQSFHALMSQGIMALERIMLTAEVHKRSNEDYFRALIQSASDVIMIVDVDEIIQYASPSALPVFGRTDLVGTSLYEVVASTDHLELKHLLDDVRAGHGPRDGVDLTAVSGDDLLLQVECTCRDLRDDPAVGGLVVTIRDVTERRRLESDLAHQAYHDHLTGLANRSLFQARLEQAARAARSTRAQVAVLFVDLDDFKEVNDTLGHAAGDQLLITVGHRIAEVAGPPNLVARTGGDEFAVLVEQDATPEDPERIAAKIVAALAEPFEVGDGSGGRHLVSGAASVGIAVSSDAPGISELLRRADVAMYVAKTDGKNTWQRYQDELHDAMVRRLEMRSALNEAVSGGQMRLRFQSIVDLPTGDMVGMEALVRWEHPHRGLLGPNEFIELSEESGAVVAIGAWVLREALTTFTDWRRSASGRHLRYVSVNVSARQFRTPGFVDQVREVLATTGARPEWLLLEITESLVLHDADQVWRDLGELRSLGVRIAIDDFGTGYSSLSYLSQMPVDVLKIDKSFIDDILHSTQQMALVETIVSLARTLDLVVVAEGIELDGHRDALVAMGCPYGQGYLFSKPVTPDEFTTLLTRRLAATA